MLERRILHECNLVFADGKSGLVSKDIIAHLPQRRKKIVGSTNSTTGRKWRKEQKTISFEVIG
jgi:hypothetical protein